MPNISGHSIAKIAQRYSKRKAPVRNSQAKSPLGFAENQTPPSYGFGRYGFGFFGPRIAFRATGALWGRATPFFYHFSVHLSSVLGRTELCHEVWTPGPQKPQIISNENHHLALLEKRGSAIVFGTRWIWGPTSDYLRKRWKTDPVA